MSFIDWVIIFLYFALSLGIGIYYSKRAGKSISEFFLSGRNLPWWLAGTSMVATTFAADTPLAVTELVAKNGIAGNWLWWNFLFGSMLTVFFFARLWRRAGILTDVEFVELRYSGKPAAFLRGFRALYLGFFINTVIMGWVNVAMASILVGMFGIPESQVRFYVFGCMILVALYSALSGLWGVAVTDAIQFVIAMTGTIVLAILVVNLPQIGGIDGLKAKIPDWLFRFTPQIGVAEIGYGGVLSLTVGAFIAYILVQWWACWYPGAEPGGGGYIAQRMMSAKNEKHSLFATLWFTIAHYCIRPWPWIVVGLSTLVLYPSLAPDEKRLGYVFTMRDFLPSGLKGLLVAAFFAAYMSTIATQLNWGTSYVINDFYKRFVKKNASEKHYVLISRITTLVVMVASILLTLIIKTISGAWQFIIEAGAGFGLVLILRWFWWRVNAWSEISAMIAPFFAYGYIKFFPKIKFPESFFAYKYIKFFTKIEFPESLFFIVSFTTVIWLIFTFLTRPVEREHLINFYRRVHPGGIGWRKISSLVPDVNGDSGYIGLFISWISGIILVYSSLFGIGKIILGEYSSGVIYILTAIGAGSIIYYVLSKIGWEKVSG